MKAKDKEAEVLTEQELKRKLTDLLFQVGRIQELLTELAHARDGYVRLDEDQCLPFISSAVTDENIGRNEAHKEMVEQNWRKVKK